MTFTRRSFLQSAAAAAPAAASAAGFSLQAGACRLTLLPDGSLASLKHRDLELADRRLGDGRPILYLSGVRLFECRTPQAASQSDGRVRFEYRFEEEPLTILYECALHAQETFTVLTQKITLTSAKRFSAPLLLYLPRNLALPADRRQVFLPLKNGIGRRKPVEALENDDEYLYQLAGGYLGGRPQRLAIPMVSEFAAGLPLNLTCCADPYFTTFFRLAAAGTPGEFHCVYPAGAGLAEGESRSFYTVCHAGDARAAMDAFYAAALAEVKPGPAWLHAVALVDSAHLSKHGAGWFADIDQLSEAIPSRRRHQVLLALHGWYDFVGRYGYNQRERALDRRWTAFPSARSPEVQALGRRVHFRQPPNWRTETMERLRPVEMSLEEVKRRIRYARDRGFRCVLYFADALSACDGVPDVYDPDKVLRWGGWRGPDTTGRTYEQNPLHPGVREFYLGYLDALLAEFGGEADGFVWDETFRIDPGDMGTPGHPGHADRAMMRLVFDLAARTAGHRSGLAFLTSDCIGVKSLTAKAPYALAAHGTYQDTGCRPEAWPYGLFPNFRNTLWSCNWYPVSHWHYNEYAARTFDVPVAVSNGYGDDTGVSGMTAAQLRRALQLFEERARRPMRITWIEETPQGLTYLGRPISHRYSVTA